MKMPSILQQWYQRVEKSYHEKKMLRNAKNFTTVTFSSNPDKNEKTPHTDIKVYSGTGEPRHRTRVFQFD